MRQILTHPRQIVSPQPFFAFWGRICRILGRFDALLSMRFPTFTFVLITEYSLNAFYRL